MTELVKNIQQGALLLLLPLLLFVASIVFASPAWRVATFIAILWYLLPAVRGRLILAYTALAASAALWILLATDTSEAFVVALLPLLLAACIPGRRRGGGDDWNPAPGVTR